jgi:zinc protease
MKRTATFGLAALALLALGSPSPLAAQQTARPRVQPPAPLPSKPAAFPPFVERTLANGAKVIVVEDHKQPVVTLNLRIRSGSASDPAGKAGTADLAASLLNKGTNTRSATDIAEAIDFVGGTLSASASADWVSIGSTVLTEFMDTALVLMSDVVLHPTFPETEFEIAQKRTLTSLQMALSQPGSLAARRFLSELYGSHPYGASPTPETVKAISRADLAAFHQAHFRPGNALFVVAGDVRADDVVARLNRHFGSWTGAATARGTHPAPPAHTAREIHFVHKPGTVQAVIRIGNLLPAATHKDWTTLDVVNQVLGGGTTGWFFRILRGEKGYTYGAYASAVQRPGPGYFQAWAEVRNEVADSAMGEFFRLLEQIRARPVDASDLKKAKDYMVGSFPLTIETPQQIAGQVASTRLLGLPADHLAKYRDRVSAVSAAELQRVARELIRPDQAVVVVVGDATRILDKIKPFGPVRLYDADGKALRPEDLEVRGSEQTFDASAIRPQTLGYRVSVQGNPVAEVKTTITREPVEGKEAVRVVAASTGMVSSEQEIVFDGKSFRPLHSRSRQQAGGQSVSIELKLEGEKVVGSMTGPDGQKRPVNVDAVAGVLLPGMDEYALWLTDFARQKELRLPVFNPMSGSVISLTARVKGESKITVPAGEFEVYEVETSGGPMPLKLYLRKGAPHLVVKQEFVGQPITSELMSVK